MHHTRSARQQKGATLVFVALWMGIALAGLMVLDIGNLFWQKRELQKIADLSALAGASGDLEQCEVNALAFANANGLKANDPPAKTHPGTWKLKTGFKEFLDTPSKNACGIQVSRAVPYFFIWPAQAGSARLLSAEAIAVQQPMELARLFIRTKVLDVSTEKPNAALLNAVVGGLLGGSLNLNVLSWEGLLNADVSLLSFLEELAPKVKVAAGDYNGLLKTEVEVGQVIDAMISALQQGGSGPLDADIKALKAIQAVALVKPLKLKLADLLQLDLSGENAGLDTRLNIFGLLQSVIQIGNKNSAVAADLNIPLGGLANLGLKLRIIEPPQWAIGSPSQMPPLQAKTAQVKLALNATVLGTGLKLDLKAGSGSVTVTDYKCTNPEDKSLSVDVQSALLDLDLELNVLGLIKVPVHFSPLRQNKLESITPPILNRTDAAPPSDLDDDAWQTVVFKSGIVKSLLDSVKETLLDTLKSGLGLLGLLVGSLLGLVLDVVNLVVEPILDPILSLLLTVLGIDLTSTDFAGQLTCGGYKATLVH